MDSSKVALITGGASGMGLAVAKSLTAQQWKVHILDLNQAAGAAAVHEDPRLAFTQTDVNSYTSLSSAFDMIYKSEGRLDFVFANAGILDMESFYQKVDSLPPPEPRHLTIDINLKAVVNTSHLARYYFLDPGNPCEDPVLVITASIASFYAQEFNPLYTASKAGVLGFMRSIASPFFKEGIRTNAICPGTVRTPLLNNDVLGCFPDEYLTPIETVVSAVEALVNASSITDANGRDVSHGDKYGLALEVFGKNIVIRDQMEYLNDGMRQICEAASLKNQQGNLRATSAGKL